MMSSPSSTPAPAKGRDGRTRKATARLMLGGSILALSVAGAAMYGMAQSPSPLAPRTEVQFSTSGNLSSKAAASAEMPSFVTLVETVKPAVVSVRVKSETDVQLSLDGDLNPFEGTPFERFFNGPRSEGRGGKGKQGKLYTQGQGSGFFISADGYAVTNNHVVQDAVAVELVTDSGETLEAKVIGTDAKSDLALLKVDGAKDFPHVKLAPPDARPKIGEWVVAMGNPFGLGGTVTAGIVSALGRDIGSGPYDDFLQIDAAVNRGNSGGPTFNINGEVVGVNTAIFSPSGGSVGIAFAIPSRTVDQVVTALKERGFVERGWLGVQIQPVTKDVAEAVGTGEAKGALVSEPQKGGPAEAAGLRPGDIITHVGETEIKDARALAQVISQMRPMTDVVLTVVRDGRTEKVTVRLGRLEDRQQEARAAPARPDPDAMGKLGLSVAPAESVAGPGAEGVAVIEVDQGGQAASSGIEAGDIITRAGGRSVSSPEDLKKALAEVRAEGKEKTLLLIKRNDAQRFVVVPTQAG